MKTPSTPGPWVVRETTQRGDRLRAFEVRGPRRQLQMSDYPDIVATLIADWNSHGEVWGNAQLVGAAPDLCEAAAFVLHHVIAPLSAGTQPEPQVLAAAHDKLFQAVKKADPRLYDAAAGREGATNG